MVPNTSAAAIIVKTMSMNNDATAGRPPSDIGTREMATNKTHAVCVVPIENFANLLMVSISFTPTSGITLVYSRGWIPLFAFFHHSTGLRFPLVLAA